MIEKELWFGYSLEKTTVYGRDVIIASPKEGTANGKWALKTEYWGAFPDVEIKLLKKGYHIAHIKNITRWYVEEDEEARRALCQYMHKERGLSEKCVVIGMSCGGMQGIYMGAKQPEHVSCMYLDAPVVELCSVVGKFGRTGKAPHVFSKEFFDAKGIDEFGLLSYREHPLDYVPKLVQNKVPVILVSGDSDNVVNYEENGKLLYDAYVKAGLEIQLHLKPGCDHHPHGLDDDSPIVDFILKHDV